MKHIFTFLFCLSLLSALCAIDISGTQTGTWDPANNPHMLVGDVTIPAGSTLTILPGVVVQATGNFRINAEGSIQAVGTETDSIYFQNAQNPPTNLWKGLRLENESEQSNFQYIVVEYAEYGINAVDSPMEVSYSRFSYNQRGLHLYGIGNSNPAAMNVHHNIIEHTMQNGILIPQNSNAWVHHNEVRYNGTVTQYYGAIQLANQSTGGANNPIIEHNYIHDNYKQGITAWDVVGAGAINPTIRFNHIEGNLTGIYLLNSSGIVHNNIIINNFIPGDTNSGAGMMIGGATSMPYIAENTLTGNFTAFYITSNAMPVLGDLAENHPWAHGQNVIQNNIDESNTLHSVVCASYPTATNVIKAENNDWGVYTPAEIAIGIMDHSDSASLPTVDFEPWFEPQTGITISGSYSWDTDDYSEFMPGELKLLLFDPANREIVESHVLQENPFSITSEIDVNFIALITGVDESREIWAAAGGLENFDYFVPGGEAISLGDIYIDAWQQYHMALTGEAQNIEGREVYPVYNSFLVFQHDSVDYFYDEGDYRYIYKHGYDADGTWQEVNFGWGQIYNKIQNMAHGESWIQNYVENGAPIQRSVQCYIDNDAGLSLLVRNMDNSIHSQTFWGYAMSFEHEYPYDGQAYADRYLDIVEIEPGVMRKYHHPSSANPIPVFRLSGAPVCGEDCFAMDFWWQAPAPDGSEYVNYMVYMRDYENQEHLIGTVDFTENTFQAPDVTGYGPAWFWVEAVTAGGQSINSEEVEFEFPVSNSDLVQQPTLNIYPNPVSFKAGTGLVLEHKGMDQPTLKVYNLRGQQVYSAKLDKGSDQWRGVDARGKQVGSGIYFLRVESANQTPLIRKIIVLK